ncbi:MAG: PIN domain-containing protein [Oscillospiraceae bacterium]|nr:PIN domain-containing protein [Treponema sp.]MBQ6540426.1 PIN domain-containing protein [Oscillospiraceae bacterium]MBQ7165546.1 PIN domain-containing protein [Treponema sp.]
MPGVVVDTSVWIDFLSPHKEASVEIQKMKRLVANHEVLVCPTVYQELLQGIRDENRFVKVKDIISLFPMLKPDFPFIEDTAVDLYRFLRRKGITIRKSNDCLIAAYALANDAPVLFSDRDFDAICDHSALRRY